MKKAILLPALLALLTGSVPVLADGKFYGSDSIPPRIPYQRALLLFDDSQETLILQSKYWVTNPTTDDSFGWVVPVPSLPELASMDPALAGSLFRVLDFDSQPRITRIGQALLTLVIIAVLLAAMLTLLACLLSYVIPQMRLVRQYRRLLIPGSLSVFVCSVFSVFLYILYNSSGPEGGGGVFGVEVIKAEQVGVYDIQVVKANQAEDLIEWIQHNRFQFDDTDTQVFDEYLQRGWCFVVARIDPSSVTDQGKVVSEGLAAPLIMRFVTETPVYPLALTSTSGHDTEIVLYVLSEGKWHNDGRLDLHYAGPIVHRDYFRLISEDVQPPDFFSDAEMDLIYLCKFKGTLTPEQMRGDLILALAEDDEPYRKHIIIW